MGEFADAIINGEQCQRCLAPITEPAGYPVNCPRCEKEDEFFKEHEIGGNSATKRKRGSRPSRKRRKPDHG